MRGKREEEERQEKSERRRHVSEDLEQIANDNLSLAKDFSQKIGFKS